MKHNYRIKLITALTSLFLITISCGEKPLLRADLSLALRLSGENRPELEKVMKHYSQNPKDSLKLKAAEFLISNMIRHYSVAGEYMDDYVKRVDSIFAKEPTTIRKIVYTIPVRTPETIGRLKTEYDLLTIKGDFLIDNIERSFAMRENISYVSALSFDDFCDYILPYRVNNEPLTKWKDSTMYDYFGFKSLDKYDFNLYQYSQFVSGKGSFYKYTKKMSEEDSLLRNYKSDCIDGAYNYLMINRAMGIPCAVDFVPFHPTKEDRHYWLTTIDNRYIHNSVSFFMNPYAAKVYRKTYSINPTPEDRDNFVPDFMRDPYNKDVTEIYEKITDVKYDFGKVPSKVKYGYLAVFNNLGWNEVAWTKLNSGKACFTKMGREIIYMPTYYDGNNQMCGNYPLFVGVNGDITEIIPNKEVTQDIVLERKFTLSDEGEQLGTSLINCIVMASNDLKNYNVDSTATISHYKNMAYDTVFINSKKKYKHWFIDNNGSYAKIAELQFFDDKGERLRGKTFKVNRDNNILEDKIPNEMFDDNLLTSAQLYKGAGMSFEKPVSVSMLKYISNNDENGIYPDNEYELFYFDNGVWVSLGRKIAMDYSINYDDTPTNALFWLRNLTKGKEERPFTVTDGKIRFW